MRHYTIKSLLRQLPNPLLERYFGGHGVLSEIDFSSLKRKRVATLFDAWNQLPEAQRSQLDAELRAIFDQSCEKGFKAIIDAAADQLSGDDLSDFVAGLSTLPNHYQRAMVTFLDYPQYWKGACYFYHADTLGHWRKRKNMGHKTASTDAASRNSFADRIRHYFHSVEGRGNHCVVDYFRRGDLDYFFAYPEDYSAQSVEWISGSFERQRLHTPAFEIIFLYSQSDGTLDLHYQGPKKLLEPLQGMFAESILKLKELPPDPKDERVYDLSPLMRRDFDWVYSAASGVDRVAVKSLRLSSKDGRGDKIILEADTDRDIDAVYRLMEKINKATPLKQYHITRIELAVQITMDVEKGPRQATIRITHPNACSLKYDERDLRLREMLAASGIEPKVPEPSGDDMDRDG